LTLIYPDGARDAESMAVDARGNAIYILSKRDSEPRLYQLPLDEALRVSGTDQTLTLTLLGNITSIPTPTPLELSLFPKYGQFRNQPTAMSLSADGNIIGLMTYGDAYRSVLGPDRDWLAALNGGLVSVEVPFLPQAETIAIDAEQTLYVTTEQQGAPLLAFRAQSKTEQ
ncbi:MAG: hypothetical protein AAGA84_12415, partial [Pseudomonadota bacterium]